MSKKTESIKGVYFDCPHDDGIPDNHDDCGKNTRYISKTNAEIVDLISEDGIDGLVYQEYNLNGTEGNIGYDSYTTSIIGATTNPDLAQHCSIYWNEVPLRDKDNGNYNYTDIELDANQSSLHLAGFPNKRVKSINEAIKGSEENTTSHHRYYKIYNKHCSKITVGIKVGALGKVDRDRGTRSEPNEQYGELLDYSVSISFFTRAIYASKMGDWGQGRTETIKGNFSSPYMRDVSIPLPLTAARGKSDDGSLNYGDFLGWELKVVRLTEEPKTPDIKSVTILDSITEEIEAPLSAPNSYIIKSKFSAEYFSQLPDRAYDVRLQKVRIPSNYDPIKRTYDGHWEGTFSDEEAGPYGAKGLYWTDNPAWCFYDLITNKRYGLGKFIDSVSFDKWTLYDIAKYCDELVSDGNGGLEPRFTCNILIQTREDAFQVLNDMASVFRAIVYYSSGNIYAVQDSLKDSVFQFTNSNVEGGDFTYTTTSAKVRHTVAIVRYNDKDNFFKPGVEYVDDVEGIRRYGIKEKEIAAFGCTSKGQAIRMGRWILATERLETETVSFTAGVEGGLVRPGDVFTVSDSHRLLKRRGGRVEEFTRIDDNKFTILLDSKLLQLDSTGAGQDGCHDSNGVALPQYKTKDACEASAGNWTNKGRNYQLTLSAPSFFFDPAQTDLVDSSQSQYIRNHHVQKFTITNEDVTYDYNNTGKTLITVDFYSGCDECVKNSGSSLNLGDVVDKMSWSILTHDVDDTAGILQEKLNQDTRYRAITVAEKEINKFEIAAVEYREEKYEEIDKALVYQNTITFNIPNGPTEFDILHPNFPITENTKGIKYKIEDAANNPGLSYYAIFVKRGSDFGAGVPSEDFLVDKVYSRADPSGMYVPPTQDNYYFRAYAVNSLGQYSSSGGTNGNGYVSPLNSSGAIIPINPGEVAPIKDVTIRALRLVDDVGTNAPGISDPVAGHTYRTLPDGTPDPEKVDFFDGSDIQMTWETAIPNVAGVNVAIGFEFRVRVYDWDIVNGKGSLLRTVEPYTPIDWDLASTTFDFTLADIIAVSSDIYNVKRGFTFEIDAFVTDSNGNKTYSSTSNTNGFDRVHAWNKPPSKAATPSGFLDINAHIKVFDTQRPIDAQSVYIIASKGGEHAGLCSVSGNDRKTKVTCEDVNKSPIGVWQDGFTAENFQNRADNNNELDNLFAFDFIKINPITSDDPVFEMDPAFKSDDLEAAFVATCYFDDFDADVLAYATENAIVYDETKLITTSRMSDVKKLEKVTPEVMDLIGEGWKAWIKIDLEGNWYGRNIQCIEDRTQHADNTGHDGYIPFYCGRRIPLIRYRAIESSSLPVGVYLSNHSSYDPLGSGFREYFSASCLYYLDNDSTLSGSDYYPNTYTKDVNLIGAYRAPTVTNPELTEITQSNHAYEGDKFVDSFKRWRVHFKPGKGFAPEHDEGGYWVIGMNVNHKEYFDEHILNVIKRLQSGPAQPNGWETYLDGDAIRALQDVTADGNDEAYIGGSDAFYNYHPAGFVQGWGGLAKEVDYFDIHMGHMIDGSYLKDAIFFVMATNSTRKPKTHSC